MKALDRLIIPSPRRSRPSTSVAGAQDHKVGVRQADIVQLVGIQVVVLGRILRVVRKERFGEQRVAVIQHGVHGEVEDVETRSVYLEITLTGLLGEVRLAAEERRNFLHFLGRTGKVVFFIPHQFPAGGGGYVEIVARRVAGGKPSKQFRLARFAKTRQLLQQQVGAGGIADIKVAQQVGKGFEIGLPNCFPKASKGT